jgi:hypothetical protein
MKISSPKAINWTLKQYGYMDELTLVLHKQQYFAPLLLLQIHFYLAIAEIFLREGRYVGGSNF